MHSVLNLAPSASLREMMPPVYNQGELGSCTGNTIAAAFQYTLKKENRVEFFPSRLFIYYYERLLEGTVFEDAGAELRDGMKVIGSYGVCDELLWPYDITKFKKRPLIKAVRDAKKHTALTYRSVPQTERHLKTALALGMPVAFGIAVYTSFESEVVARTGVAQMPSPEDKSLGGHAILLVGYDDTTRRFTLRNSWGSEWGDGGYFTLPYEYVLNPDLACDFWVISALA